MLGGLTPHKLIAVGESQSAGRLVTYVDAVHPLAHVYDGFLVHSRFSSGAALSQAPQVSVPAPATAMMRNDLDVPVFVFETESDVLNSRAADRQPDTGKFRLWEVAGTSHYDHYGLVIGPADTGNGQGAVLNLAAMQHPPSTIPGPVTFSCAQPINTGGAHWVLDAAIAGLNRWVVNGTPPPHGHLLQTTGVSPVVFARDANGNVRGGVRSPHVDAPLAALGGVGNGGTGPVGIFCGLFGTTVPFSASTLAGLYKSHSQFVARWTTRRARPSRTGSFANQTPSSSSTRLAPHGESSSVGATMPRRRSVASTKSRVVRAKTAPMCEAWTQSVSGASQCSHSDTACSGVATRSAIAA